MMPEMDGYEVCKRIKEIPEKKDIPIVFLSALDKVENVKEAVGVGASGYLVKPFNKQLVTSTIKKFLPGD